MSKYYRFRTIDRLLGKPAEQSRPAQPGELDELTIYFASPIELNDPLEGHRETYFKGDRIVWRNLIKHYALLLYASAVDVYINDGDGTIKHINLRPDMFDPEARIIISEILEAVAADQPISTYLEVLAGTGRRVEREELTAHLMTIHNLVLHHILIAIDKRFEIPDTARYKTIQKTFTDFTLMRANEIKREGAYPHIASYKELTTKIRQQVLRGNAAREVELGSGLIRVYLDFPKEFAQQIDYLVYPHWYVACFMETCSNPAIWGSYGDNHKGICLIYETKKHRGADTLTIKGLPWDYVRSINEGRPKHEWYLNMPCQMPLMSVKYNAQYTATNFFTSLRNDEENWVRSYWYTDGLLTSPDAQWLEDPANPAALEAYRKMYEQSVTTKTSHWENEAERRIVLLGFPFTKEERVVRYNFSDLKGLVFGINTRDDVKVRIIRKIAHHCKQHRRSDFKFYQARYGEGFKSIEHDHLSHITFKDDGALDLDPQMS